MGPFRVGMQASSLVRSGLVAEVPVTECGTRFELTQKVERNPGGVGVEFRDGSPTDLDFVVVTATSLKTAKGIRVGSTRAQVKAAYGTLPFVAGDLGGRYTQGIFDGKGHVLLLIYGDGAGNGDDRVYAMETGLGNTPSTTRMGWWEC